MTVYPIVTSKHSQWKSTCSGKHSHNSAKPKASSRVKAEAEKAALLARAAALKKKNALEAQEEQLRRKREQLDMDAAIAASSAKLEVYQGTSECSNKSLTPSDRMNSYLQRKEAQKANNPAANRFNLAH